MSRPSPITTEKDAHNFADTQPLVSSTSITAGRSSVPSNLSFKEKVYGLLSPASTEVTDYGNVLNEEEYLDKVAAIQDCLRGIAITVSAGDSSKSKSSTSPTKTNEKQGLPTKKKKKKNKEQIDLWHLRELALQPGGLLEPSLRKRAWPLLTAVDFQQQTPPGTTTTPSSADLAALHREVPHTVWDVQEHFEQQQLHQQQKQSQHLFYSDSNGKMFKNVSFAEQDGETKKDDSDAGAAANETSSTSHSSCCSTWSGTSHSTGRRHRWRTAGELEQTIVSNAVTSCLQRTPAQESVYFEDDRYHYFSGLHDLTALLMINLESPSLSSLVLEKLAQYHLRDAMRKERTVMESALEVTFFPVLERVDPVLYQHLVVQAGLTTMPDFLVHWVSNWFATDMVDLTAASRLVDAFLVSHAAMPLYCAVALLTCHRQRLLECEDWKDVRTVLQTLPLFAAGADDSNNNSLDMDDDWTIGSQGSRTGSSSSSSSLEQVEQIIATGLRFMKRIPPSTLVAVVRKSNDNQALVDRIPSIAMFDTSAIPKWCLADTSPNEYAILRRAKKIRQGRLTKEHEADASSASRPTAALFSYPLAMKALGRGGTPRKRPRFNACGFASKLLCLLMIVAILLNPSPHCQSPPSQSQLSSLLPSTVAPSKPSSGMDWKAHGLFRHRASVPKNTKPFPTKEVAADDESEARGTDALLPPHNKNKIKPGWKVFLGDTPRKFARFTHRYLIAPATRKVNPFPHDKVTGQSFPRMI